MCEWSMGVHQAQWICRFVVKLLIESQLAIENQLSTHCLHWNVLTVMVTGGQISARLAD